MSRFQLTAVPHSLADCILKTPRVMPVIRGNNAEDEDLMLPVIVTITTTLRLKWSVLWLHNAPL